MLHLLVDLTLGPGLDGRQPEHLSAIDLWPGLSVSRAVRVAPKVLERVASPPKVCGENLLLLCRPCGGEASMWSTSIRAARKVFLFHSGVKG